MMTREELKRAKIGDCVEHKTARDGKQLVQGRVIGLHEYAGDRVTLPIEYYMHHAWYRHFIGPDEYSHWRFACLKTDG